MLSTITARRIRLLLAWLLLAAWLILSFSLAAHAAGPVFLPLVSDVEPLAPLPPGWSSYEVRVVELANQERAANGCTVMLAMNDKLHKAAYDHSADMLARDFFSHTNPDGEGPSQRIAEVGYIWSSWGENIAAGCPSPEDVMAGWMDSAGHRANILNCNFMEIGVGYVYADTDGGEAPYHHYWTQVFGTPRR